jgi:hypothetical protein
LRTAEASASAVFLRGTIDARRLQCRAERRSADRCIRVVGQSANAARAQGGLDEINLVWMQRQRKSVKLPIAAYVAERDTRPEGSPAPNAVDWREAETASFYRPLDRPLTLGSDAIEHLRSGDAERAR